MTSARQTKRRGHAEYAVEQHRDSDRELQPAVCVAELASSIRDTNRADGEQKHDGDNPGSFAHLVEIMPFGVRLAPTDVDFSGSRHTSSPVRGDEEDR